MTDEFRNQPADRVLTFHGTGHGSMYRNCYGRNANCGPRSPVGSTRPNGRFYCRECSEARAARAAVVNDRLTTQQAEAA